MSTVFILLMGLHDGVAGLKEDVNAALREGHYDKAENLLKNSADDPTSVGMLMRLRTFRADRFLNGPADAPPSQPPMPAPAAPPTTRTITQQNSEPALPKVPTRTWKYNGTNCWITNVGGYDGAWSIVYSEWSDGKKAGWDEQYLLDSPVFPEERLGALATQGHHITTLAGDGNRWLVVTSKPSGYEAQVVLRGEDGLPETQMVAYQNAGWHITGVAGWDSRWTVVLSKGMKWGRQRYSRPGPIPWDWVKARYAEGYAITSIAGDNDKMETDSFCVVMTPSTAIKTQRIYFSKDDASSPGELLLDKKSGHDIQQSAGYTDRRVWVTGQGLPFKKQLLHLGALGTGDQPVSNVSTISR